MIASGQHIVPVILAGGTGTRLWPRSRTSLPKQFLTFNSQHSLFQETLLRVSVDAGFEAPIVITSEQFHLHARHQAEAIGIHPRLLLEPARRDSAPALIAATRYVADQIDPAALILALASDHVVRNTSAFRLAVRTAAQVATHQHIVTFGMTPDAPRTSYGYIKCGGRIGLEDAYKVEAFVEKPDEETASGYLRDGYLWNSGNFLFPPELLLQEAEKYAPEITAAALKSVATAVEDRGVIRIGTEAFRAAKSKSIDFAVLERTERAAVVKSDFGWSDVGSWDAVRALGDSDAQGNVTRGPCALLDTQNSHVHSEGPLVTGIGLRNLSVIATRDAILVMPSHRSQDVKALVAQLKAKRHNAVDEPVRLHGAWGTCETLSSDARLQVKKIVVAPGGMRAPSTPAPCAEHWIVVRGRAEVTLSEKGFTLKENETAYIPQGCVHRLANPGRIPLELIAVQIGFHDGEDDRVRPEDAHPHA